jgi:HKD family nuclease
MKTEHLKNTYIKFDSEIVFQLSECTSFSIATAFINDYAIDLIENTLKRNKALKQGTLLIGIFQHFNRQKDIERLKQLAKQYPHILKVNISLDKKFHWKYYHFETARNNSLYIGSANFTTGGLKSNSEIVVKLTDTKRSKDKSLNNLITAFDKELLNSKSISLFPISKYKEQLLKNDLSSANKINPELKAFFDSKQKKQEREIISDKAVVSYLCESVCNSTEKAVYNHSPEMNISSVDYFVCNSKAHYDACVKLKNLLIIVREGRNNYEAFWSKVVGYEDIKTPDGKYFIFYALPKKETTIKPEMESILKKKFRIDLRAYKEPFLNMVAGKRQVEELKKLIKK